VGVGAEAVGGVDGVDKVCVQPAVQDSLVSDDSHHPLAGLGVPLDVSEVGRHVLMIGVLLAGVVSKARTFSMNT
jgi:hypothetical protein